MTRRISHVHVIRFFISFCKITPDGKNDEEESLMMGDFNTYLIELCGMMDEADINVMSTLELKAVSSEVGHSRFSVCTDQSGLIGLLRQIHARGIKLNSVVKVNQSNHE